MAASADLQAQLRLQDEVAQKLKTRRYENGALNLQTDELHPLVLNGQVVDVVKQQKNRATELIEDFMIAANGVVARMLEKVSSLRRIVKQPERWDRIVQLAATHGEKLPPIRTPKRSTIFCSSAKRPIRIILPTFRWP